MGHHLADVLNQLGHPRVLVLGDAILDRYIWGNAERVSQEAPVILLRADHDETRLGGAANVANMLSGLEAEVTLVSVIGEDYFAGIVRRELELAGISHSSVLSDRGRPTTVKERFMGRAQNRHPHQMLRVDREVRDALSTEVTRRLLPLLLAAIPEHQAVLVSDYGKGVCTPEIVQATITACRNAGVPVIVDPRPGTDYSLYQGTTAVTPNRLETKLATGIEIRTINDAIAAGTDLCTRLSLDHAYITLDSDGMVVVRADGSASHAPTRKRQVYDITGAGDMVLATIGVGLAAGLEPLDIARLANIAGGLEVERVGVVPITRQEMLDDIQANDRSGRDKVCTLDQLEPRIAQRRKLGQKIVMTNGCFDILHAGHVEYLQQAAREGDCLIVAINSDHSIRTLNKGPERPIFPEQQRAAMLAALEAVDFVTIFEQSTPHALLERLSPDLLVKGGAYSHNEIVGWEIVESYGGSVKPLGQVPGLSTTRIIERLREKNGVIPRPHIGIGAGSPDTPNDVVTSRGAE